jgi:subtilisin family serine protease
MVTALALLVPAPLAAADDATAADAAGASGAAVAAVVDLPLEDLPVDAVDVTASDRSLANTRNEVTVLVTTDEGPEVRKLRTDSPADQQELVEHLDAQRGVVAAPTVPLRRLELPLPAPEPFMASQWNLAMVGLPEAWRTTQGLGVTVAVVDSGVDGSHPDLVGRVMPTVDLTPGPAVPSSAMVHGTRVASLVAGNLNGIGMAGVAPQANILPVEALDVSGVGDSATVARAIIAAADRGARVINLSLGGPDRDPVLDSACAYAFARGAVLVAAGGNSYQDGNAVQYPAASPNVVAVASVNASGAPSVFSNTGRHIALAAPGERVLAAYPGGGYNRESGTSFAAPHVSGAMALVAAANPSLSAPQIVSVTQLTAQDDVSGNGRDQQYGHGIVRADRAVAAALSLQGSGLAPNARLRLRTFDASPEPVRRRAVLTLRATVQARAQGGSWRADPRPALVRFEFRPNGSSRYRTVGDAASGPKGVAVLYVAASGSGYWRAKVRQANGSWTTSRVDHVRVRR